jgi:predicted nucleic acid-binding protein
MRTAVDSSLLLDVILDDPRWADRSEAALRAAATAGALVIGECVLAEIAPAFESGAVDEFMADWGIEFVPSTRTSAILAGEMFARYLKRRPGPSARVLPDFLIGAHARYSADRLLARDRGYYRDYFRDLPVVVP